MTRRRSKSHSQLKLSIWQRDGKLYFVEQTELRKAIAHSGNSTAVIEKRMGHGYHHLQDALNGQRIDEWAAAHIEWGLTPDNGYTRL